MVSISCSGDPKIKIHSKKFPDNFRTKIQVLGVERIRTRFTKKTTSVFSKWMVSLSGLGPVDPKIHSSSKTFSDHFRQNTQVLGVEKIRTRCTKKTTFVFSKWMVSISCLGPVDPKIQIYSKTISDNFRTKTQVLGVKRIRTRCTKKTTFVLSIWKVSISCIGPLDPKNHIYSKTFSDNFRTKTQVSGGEEIRTRWTKKTTFVFFEMNCFNKLFRNRSPQN
jgi:uncharacterized protein YeaO (DUF488 family)